LAFCQNEPNLNPDTRVFEPRNLSSATSCDLANHLIAGGMIKYLMLQNKACQFWTIFLVQ